MEIHITSAQFLFVVMTENKKKLEKQKKEQKKLIEIGKVVADN